MLAWLSLYAMLAKAAVLGTGLVILFYTARAAKHTGDGGLWFLSLGILLTGVGLFFSGWLPALVGVDPEAGMALTSTVAAVGLGIVVYSMFTTLGSRPPKSTE